MAAFLPFSGALGFAEPQAGRCPAETWEPARILQGANGDPAALERFPESASAIRRLIAAAHQAGDSVRVGTGLARLADMGYALSPQGQDQLAAHVTPEQAAALRHVFAANRAAVGSSRLVDTVPADRRLVEGIARDRRTGRLFATSVVGRELLVRDRRGWRAVPGVAAGSLFGMAVGGSRRLWIASGSVEQTPSPETAFRGLVALDMDSLRVVGRIAVEGSGSPGDVTVGPDGTLFASDPIGGALYRARPGAPVMSLLVPPGRLRSPQGMALSPDGSRLYVADHGYGIAVVHLASGRITRLAARDTAMLDGVDGLLADRDGLIVIQNGTDPRRIVRLRLGPDCDQVTSLEILERANPSWGEPTLGMIDGLLADRDGLIVTDPRRIVRLRLGPDCDQVTSLDILERANPSWGEPTLGMIDGGELLYVADAQWDRYGAAGAVRGDGPTRPTAIRALRLRGRVARSAQ